MSVGKSPFHFPVEGMSFQWAPAAFAQNFVGCHFPRGIGAYQHKVCPVTFTDIAALVDAVDLCGSMGTFFSTMVSRVKYSPHLPVCSMLTSENCIIGMPDMAFKAPPSFSASRWGAWSVAITSIRPELTAARRASRSACFLMAGLHLIRVPNVR